MGHSQKYINMNIKCMNIFIHENLPIYGICFMATVCAKFGLFPVGTSEYHKGEYCKAS